MKKYFLTVATIALFAVGFAASDEEGSSSSESSTPQTEQKQETEAERNAREKKEKENRKNEVAKKAYDKGYEKGFNGESDIIGDPKTISYTVKYGAPKTNEEKELFNIWEENWQKGYEEGNRARYSN